MQQEGKIRRCLRVLSEALTAPADSRAKAMVEDAATAEISRAQVWQWMRHPRGVLTDGRKVTRELFRTVLDEEIEKIKNGLGAEGFSKSKYAVARQLFDSITTEDTFVEFLTLSGYEKLD